MPVSRAPLIGYLQRRYALRHWLFSRPYQWLLFADSTALATIFGLHELTVRALLKAERLRRFSGSGR